jgi:hypothetical protein
MGKRGGRPGGNEVASLLPAILEKDDIFFCDIEKFKYQGVNDR